MTNSTFEIEDLPEVPGGTWKIVNNATVPGATTTDIVVKLELEGQDDIEVVIGGLEPSDIIGGVQYAMYLYQNVQAFSSLSPSGEITLVPKPKTGDSTSSDD